MIKRSNTISENENSSNFLRVLTYGLSPIEFAAFQVQIPKAYEIKCCNDEFTDLLAFQSSCIILNPNVLSDVQIDYLNQCYENEERVIFLLTERTTKSFSFRTHTVNLTLRYNRNMEQVVKLLKSATFPCYKSCEGFVLNDGFVMIDIETTGLDSLTDEIISISAIRVADFKIMDRYKTLVKPKKMLDSHIVKLTGITNKMVATAPTLKDVISEFSQWYQYDPLVMYNGEFDFNFLRSAYYKTGHSLNERGEIDIMYLATKLYANRLLESKKRINEVATELLGHNAIGQEDIDAYANLFLYLLEKLRSEYDFHDINSILKLYDTMTRK